MNRSYHSMRPYPRILYIIMLTVLACRIPVDAVTVYRNTFDDSESLDDFTVHGETFTGYNPPPLHSVSVDTGQLRMDTSYQRPNGPGLPPALFGRAYLSLDASAAFHPGYDPMLSQNSGLISWSFNISNQDGAYNNYFACVLASTKADPYDTDAGFARGYAFCGGGMVGDRMLIKRFDYGMGGGSRILIDVSDGLGPLPDKGSLRITFDPATSMWSLYGKSGPEYNDPTQVETLLGSCVDNTYTDIETPYCGLLSMTTGTTFFDNFTVDSVPEPASVVFIVSGLLAVGFVRRMFFA